MDQPTGDLRLLREAVLLAVSTTPSGEVRRCLVSPLEEPMSGPLHACGLWSGAEAEAVRGLIERAGTGEPGVRNVPLRTGARDAIALLRAVPEASADGVTSVRCTAVDVSELAHEREAQHVIAAELHHRLKNAFSMVIAIAQLCLDDGSDEGESKASFLKRLHNLADAQDLLEHHPRDAVRVGTMVEKILRPFLCDGVSVSTGGPEAFVTDGDALRLALVMHELATNAAKHGALSSQGGRIDVAWQLLERADGPQIELSWHEWGTGPGPDGASDGQGGFGSVLLNNIGRRGPDGKALRFGPDGVRFSCRVDVLPKGGQSEAPHVQ